MFRRLVEHLRGRTDVQNIDLMNLAGFCRNCLGNWMKDAADAQGVALSKDESREAVYGMPYEEWKAKHQKEASPAQQAGVRQKPQALRRALRRVKRQNATDRLPERRSMTKLMCTAVDDRARTLT